jgi:hypothetical protein
MGFIPFCADHCRAVIKTKIAQFLRRQVSEATIEELTAFLQAPAAEVRDVLEELQLENKVMVDGDHILLI